MKTTTYIQEVLVGDGLTQQQETVEIHRCPHCKALFGIDVTYLIQVSETVTCIMCSKEVTVADAIDEVYQEEILGKIDHADIENLTDVKVTRS